MCITLEATTEAETIQGVVDKLVDNAVQLETGLQWCLKVSKKRLSLLLHIRFSMQIKICLTSQYFC